MCVSARITFNAAILRRRAPPRRARPLIACLMAAGCGSTEVHRIAEWDRARRTSRRPSPPADAPRSRPPARPAASKTAPGPRRPRAAAERPTDAEVQRELERGLRIARRAGDRRRRAEHRRPRHRPARRAIARGGHHQRRQLGRAQALRLRRRPRAPGRRDVRRHRLRLLGLGLLRAGRRRPGRQPDGLLGARALRQARPRALGDDLRQRRPRLHDRGRACASTRRGATPAARAGRRDSRTVAGFTVRHPPGL